MKRLFTAAALLVGLVGCSSKIDPVGVYLLDTGGKSYTLTMRAGGDYSLYIASPGMRGDEIRGRWQDDDATGRSISFSGIVWAGTEPQAGNGYWKANIEGHSQKICLDGEGLTCFSKTQ
jgi:hypothetical protein